MKKCYNYVGDLQLIHFGYFLLSRDFHLIVYTSQFICYCDWQFHQASHVYQRKGM